MDDRARWLRFIEAQTELIERCAFTFDLDEDALREIQHPPGEAQFRREAIDEWAKADALHRATHDAFQAHNGFLALAKMRRREGRRRSVLLIALRPGVLARDLHGLARKSFSTKPMW